MDYKIAGKVVSKRDFLKLLKSGHVINVLGAKSCRSGCKEIMYLQARLAMGNYFVCNAGHEYVGKR